MSGLFETVLVLSAIGFCITSVLLLVKPITVKKFPAGWQYCVWILVLLTMLVPVYKLIPDSEVQRIQYITRIEVPGSETAIVENSDVPHQSPIINEQPSPVPEVVKVKIFDLLSIVWLCGTSIYLATVLISYFVYILRKWQNSDSAESVSVLDEVRKELGIRRNIKVRVSSEVGSPMLVGVVFPVIYMPHREISPEMMRLVFLHELTHYKRKDLLIKWFALFVNAVHWFNPMAYLLCANLSEACEISCDMKVTMDMGEEEQRLYMKTILELVE